MRLRESPTSTERSNERSPTQPLLSGAIDSLRVAPEGVPIVLTVLGLSLAVVALVRRLWLPLAALNAFCLWFFRDPNRQVPPVDERTVLSPADGKVIAVTDLERDPDLQGPARRISIFLSLFEVHVQRSPIRGRVVAQRYNPGCFKMAFHEKASELNEQLTTVLSNDRLKVKVVQIAGYVARRIVSRIRPGDQCLSGQRIGLIRFGSRVDLTLPAGVATRVAVGDRVLGGETIIGSLP